jgi:hypothetical protein
MIECLYENYKTHAQFPHGTHRPADLLVRLRGLDSDLLDMDRHAIAVIIIKQPYRPLEFD